MSTWIVHREMEIIRGPWMWTVNLQAVNDKEVGFWKRLTYNLRKDVAEAYTYIFFSYFPLSREKMGEEAFTM